MKLGIFSYILRKGTDYLKTITDQEISEMEEGNYILPKFIQAFNRAAVNISKSCITMQIMNYIRMSCNFPPFLKRIVLLQEDYTKSNWFKLCDQLGIDEKETEIELLVLKKIK